MSGVIFSSGGGHSHSVSFELEGTIGEPVVDAAASASFSLASGQWAGRHEPSPSEPTGLAPARFIFASSTPNPFAEITTIHFGLPQSARVDLQVFDATGRMVRELLRAVLAPASYSIPWDGRDDRSRSLPTGMYYIRMHSDQFTATRRTILLH